MYQSGNSSKKQLLLHRARLQVFKGDSPNDKRIVRHLNGDASDNTIDNLAWGTHQENMTDLKAHGSQKGSKNPSSKINEYEAVAIYVITELGLLNYSTRLKFCSLSQTQIYKIQKIKAWEHSINQNIQDWVHIAKNLLIEKNLELVNKNVIQKNNLAEKRIKEIKNKAIKEIQELKDKIENL